MRIGKVEVSNTGKPVFIADIAANHDGDLKRAYKLIELAKDSGADIAKFQNFKAKKIVSKNAFDAMPKQTHQAEWNKSVFDVYDEASVPDSWTPLLKKKCDEVGIEYMTSPYDYESVELADKYSDAFKIGSGDITWTNMLEYIAAKGKPVLLATGASDIADVERAMACIKPHTEDIVLMQCNTDYTLDLDKFKYINLNVLNLYRQKFPECILGLSDHTLGYATVLGAFTLGARVFEKHFTDDNSREGPDHKFAMNPAAWREMVDECNKLYYAMGDGVKRIENNERDSVTVQQRCFFYQKDLKAGHTVTEDDIFPVRPLQPDCFYPYESGLIVGKKLVRDVSADTSVRRGDLMNNA